MTLKGQKKFERNLEQAIDRYRKAIAAGVYGECGNIVADSVENAPVDTGSLRRSHYVTEPYDSSLTSVACEFGCGGVAEDYAVKVHETHKTKGKFLQNAMNEAKADAIQNVAAIARHAFSTNNTKIKKPTISSSDGSWTLAETPDETPRSKR